jgi:hypothetical protein
LNPGTALAGYAPKLLELGHLMKFRMILAGAAVAAVTSFAAASASATVVYQSNPNGATNGVVDNYWCSDCYGGDTFEPLDPFTLASGATIDGVNLQTFNDFGYNGLDPFTIEIYSADRSSIIFSQALTSTLVSNQVDSSGYNNDTVHADITGLTLSAGDYWIGFIAPHLAIAGVGGGNGGLIDTTPHTGNVSPYADGGLGDNSAYQLVSGGVPEPAGWALMLTGFLGAGAALRANRRRTAAATA